MSIPMELSGTTIYCFAAESYRCKKMANDLTFQISLNSYGATSENATMGILLSAITSADMTSPNGLLVFLNAVEGSYSPLKVYPSVSEYRAVVTQHHILSNLHAIEESNGK